MKKVSILLLSLFSYALLGQPVSGNLDISVTTIPNGKAFSPKHVLAIWLEDDAGNFVKTLKLRADKRKQYLYSWNSASSGNTTDAITGSTLSSHETHNVNWDCTDVSGATVADGSYTVFIEYTSEHAQGPITSIDVTKSAESFSVQPADLSYFTEMDVVFTPESVTGIAHQPFNFTFTSYPVPASDVLHVVLELPDSERASIKVYSADMKLVKELWMGSPSGGKITIDWNIREDGLAPGNYFLVLQSDKQLSSRQIILAN